MKRLFRKGDRVSHRAAIRQILQGIIEADLGSYGYKVRWDDGLLSIAQGCDLQIVEQVQ